MLPDAAFLVAAAREFDRQSHKLLASAKAYKPNTTDALSALVVMVPTMGEYFGALEELALRDRRQGHRRFLQRRLAPQRHPRHPRQPAGRVRRRRGRRSPRSTPTRRPQTRKELDGLAAFIERIYKRERAGHRFTPQDADLLGKQAQDRAVKVAGQVSQAAAKLGIKVEQG